MFYLKSPTTVIKTTIISTIVITTTIIGTITYFYLFGNKKNKNPTIHTIHCEPTYCI